MGLAPAGDPVTLQLKPAAKTSSVSLLERQRGASELSHVDCK